MGGVGQERHREEDQKRKDSSIPGPGLAQRVALNFGHDGLLWFLMVPWMCCVTVG